MERLGWAFGGRKELGGRIFINPSGRFGKGGKENATGIVWARLEKKRANGAMRSSRKKEEEKRRLVIARDAFGITLI